MSLKPMSEIIKEKFAALLHDPPNKPFIFSLNAFNEEKRISHVKVAKTLISHLDFLGKNELDEISSKIYSKKEKGCNSKVSDADSLASKFDRYLTTLIYQERGRKQQAMFANFKEIVMKNFLAPELEVNLSAIPSDAYHDPSGKDIKEFFNYLSEVFKKLGLTGVSIETYNVFYFFYEFLWVAKGYTVGPADTRVPTHSIFDHLYATASIINWFLGSTDLLLGLDIVGVADYINKSRKLRDLWASSYLVSALIWYVLISFVEKFGADSVLFPSLRFNPFFATYIYHKYLKNKEKDELIKEIVNYITTYIFNGDETYKKLGIPPYPIIPARATLILLGVKYVSRELGLKKSDISCIEKYVITRFNEGWGRLIDHLITYALSHTDNPFWALFNKVIEKESVKNAVKIPPVQLRVITLKKENEVSNYEEFDNRYRELVSNFKRKKLSKVSPHTQLSNYNYYIDSIGETKRGFEYCSICGVLPAMLILPKDENEYKKFVEEHTGKQFNDDQIEALKAILSPGEKLCPWCLIKRAIGVRPEFLRVLITSEDLRSFEEKDVFIPSVSHVAFYKKFEKLKEDNIINPDKENTISLWKYYETYPIEKRGLLRENPEEKGWKDVSPYYALVRADTDYLGDLLEGKVTPYLAGIIDSSFYGGERENESKVKNAITRYLRNAAKGLYQEVINDVLKEDINQAKELIKNAAVTAEIEINDNDIERIISDLKDFLNKNVDRDRLLLFPSWHVSISSMLNRILLKEIQLVNALGGFVVYAGGDDLLAILPVENALQFVENSRKIVAGIEDASSYKGFIKINNSYFSQLPLVGRSYILYFSHVKYPLQLALEESYNLLEEGKERVKYDKYKKDIVIFKYRNSVSFIPLSLIRPYEENNDNSIKRYLDNLGKSLELLRILYDAIRQKKLSKSLIYDALADTILKSRELESEILVKYLDYLVDKNKIDKSFSLSFVNYQDILKISIINGETSEPLTYNLFKALSIILGAEKIE
ncbi:type III-B CRISPR-associated protein Cas10/Cmr2 [Sulfurisphaera tokodaii]|nr:type III-B CRISPR-associated protein Cas10/Cmr2 [Sulfurisphaera tokodaii]HII74444.1 type III-B CRISPR-associated protein Cas10/Cmr2 [Sulfurisphaera tokodaii]